MHKYVGDILREFGCDTRQFSPLLGDPRIVQGPIPIEEAKPIWYALRHAHEHTSVWPIVRGHWPLEYDSTEHRRDPIEVLRDCTDASLAQFLVSELRHWRHSYGWNEPLDLKAPIHEIALRVDQIETSRRPRRKPLPTWKAPESDSTLRVPPLFSTLEWMSSLEPRVNHATLCLFERIEPPDTLAWLGFSDGSNAPDTEVLVPAARRWHTRHGARPALIGGDILEFFVERPPMDEAASLTLALEQALLCSEVLMSDDATDATIRWAAEGLAGETYWFFWWD